MFTGLLLADEINRTPPKTQAALLEAMQEHQVTVEGQTFQLPQPFHVLATANPVEYEGTYPLPEAQLDRFLVRVAFGYPDADGEWEVLRPTDGPPAGGPAGAPVVDAAELLELQATMEDVTVYPSRPLLRGAGRGPPATTSTRGGRLATWLAGADAGRPRVRRHPRP